MTVLSGNKCSEFGTTGAHPPGITNDKRCSQSQLDVPQRYECSSKNQKNTCYLKDKHSLYMLKDLVVCNLLNKTLAKYKRL